ncbi:hypothetical protein MA03_07305 [Infirmifilum uzonense]|uniref:Uncharacterized protein n=1 Tax=Infirmifilum uzonense TaxID=1550241 RepID=A0A0F7FIB4_9CREN|nr:hypothetical protein [Infirmifilum uzonense]AKG39087.1 hypothetical protein MA03_07305 [Infirmifilum uzonense]
MDPGLAPVIAYVLFLLETLYISYKLYVGGRRDYEERFWSTLAALVVALPLMFLDVALVAGLFGVPGSYLDYSLTLRYAYAVQQAANQTLSGLPRWSAWLGTGIAIVETLAWGAALVSGGLSLLIGYASAAGLGLVKATLDAATMSAQAMYAVSRLYELAGLLAPYARTLVPVGLALAVSRRTRPLGAVIVAVGVFFGYAMPFALNVVAWRIQEVQAPGAPQGALGAVCLNVVTCGSVGKWGNTTCAGFPALVELGDLTHNRTVVRQSGRCFVDLAGNYTVRAVWFGPLRVSPNESLIAPSVFEVKPAARVKPGREVPDALTGRVRDLNYTEFNNVTIVVHWGPGGRDRDVFTITWVPGQGASWVATDGFHFPWVNVEWSREPWFNATYFSRADYVEASLWGVGRQKMYTGNVTLPGNRTVTVNCTEVEAYVYGTLLGDPQIVDRGLTYIEVNGTRHYLVPEVKVTVRRYLGVDPESYLSMMRRTIAPWFNQSARVLNATLRGHVYLELVNNTVAKMHICPTTGPGYWAKCTTFENPAYKWGIPYDFIPIEFAEARYCGHLVRPARVRHWLALDTHISVGASTVAATFYDSSLEWVAEQKLELYERARGFFINVYEFIALLGITFGLAVAGVDALSGFLEGPSVTFAFMPRGLRRSYWSIVVSRLPSIASALAGKALPVPRVAYDAALSVYVEALPRLIRQHASTYPLRRLKEALREKGRALLADVSGRLSVVEEALNRHKRLLSGVSAVDRVVSAVRGLAEATRLSDVARITVTFARLVWEERDTHAVNSFLRAVAGTLRSEARRMAGEVPVQLHPRASVLASIAGRIEWLEAFLNPRELYKRAVFITGMALYNTPRTVVGRDALAVALLGVRISRAMSFTGALGVVDVEARRARERLVEASARLMSGDVKGAARVLEDVERVVSGRLRVMGLSEAEVNALTAVWRAGEALQRALGSGLEEGMLKEYVRVLEEALKTIVNPEVKSYLRQELEFLRGLEWERFVELNAGLSEPEPGSLRRELEALRRVAEAAGRSEAARLFEEAARRAEVDVWEALAIAGRALNLMGLPSSVESKLVEAFSTRDADSFRRLLVEAAGLCRQHGLGELAERLERLAAVEGRAAATPGPLELGEAVWDLRVVLDRLARGDWRAVRDAEDLLRVLQRVGDGRLARILEGGLLAAEGEHVEGSWEAVGAIYVRARRQPELQLGELVLRGAVVEEAAASAMDDVVRLGLDAAVEQARRRVLEVREDFEVDFAELVLLVSAVEGEEGARLEAESLLWTVVSNPPSVEAAGRLAAYASRVVEREYREALEAYSRALSLSGSLNLHPGESRAMQAFQADHARRAYHALTEAVEEVHASRTRIASLRIYADILPEYRKTLNDIDAMLRELEELRSRIEGLLEE